MGVGTPETVRPDRDRCGRRKISVRHLLLEARDHFRGETDNKDMSEEPLGRCRKILAASSILVTV